METFAPCCGAIGQEYVRTGNDFADVIMNENEPGRWLRGLLFTISWPRQNAASHRQFVPDGIFYNTVSFRL